MEGKGKTENERTEEESKINEDRSTSSKSENTDTVVPVKSSCSTELFMCFDDDFEFHIDWEKELARPFYNSTAIRSPRVPVPKWAEWDFSKNDILRQQGLQNATPKEAGQQK